jgi:hypothetical protein
LGRNIRAEKLFDSRKKTNRVKARNVKRGKSTYKEDKEDSSEDDYDAWEVVYREEKDSDESEEPKKTKGSGNQKEAQGLGAGS